jgi:hypothetical protein
MKLFFIFLFLVSCGASPLFNHKLENNRISDTLFSESDELKFEKTNYSFIVSWIDGPKLGESKFILKTWDRNHGTLNGPYQDLILTPHVFLWMPAMGHGSAPVKIKKIAQGEYEISSVQFIMGGKWEIKFQLLKDDKIFDETVILLSL